MLCVLTAVTNGVSPNMADCTQQYWLALARRCLSNDLRVWCFIIIRHGHHDV